MIFFEEDKMAKAVKVPTLEEMQEYLKLWKADSKNRINDVDHRAMLNEMTLRIFTVDMPDDVKPVAWKFCKELTKFAHAPVSPAEYKRMEKWLGEHGLIDVLLKACDGYYPDPKFDFGFDIVGFFYSIALISQSQYRRKDCLALLDKITQYYIKTKHKLYTVLLRNMQKLVKDFPDLAGFKTALESI